MVNESQGTVIDGVKVHIPSVKHMIALKLHALKSRQLHREAKDFEDLVQLIKIAKIDPNTEEFRQFVEKYGIMELEMEIRQSC